MSRSVQAEWALMSGRTSLRESRETKLSPSSVWLRFGVMLGERLSNWRDRMYARGM